MASKFLYLTKGIASRNGAVENVVQGAAKVFLKNIYGTNSPIRVNTIDAYHNGQPVTRSVTNIEGVYKVDQLMAKQLKFFFNADIPEGDFLNIRVALWGKPGENLAKFNVNDGDLYMFMLRNVSLESYSRKKNNTTGYQLNAQAFDFEPLKTKKADENNSAAKTPQAAAPKPVQAVPQAPVQNDYSYDDFAAIDDSDDLPF